MDGPLNTDNIIPPELVEQFEREYTAMLRRRNWTDLRVVSMGAVIGGVQRVVVPEAQRRSPYEIYFTELDGSGHGTAINANSSTPNQYGMLIHIGHPPIDKDRWHVYQRVVTNEIDQVTNEPGTLSHASQHTLRNVGFDGGSSVGYVGQDPVFLDDRQFAALSLWPDAGLTVRITPGWIMFDATRKWFGGSINDLTSEVPATSGKALYLLVEIDSDLTVYTTAGSEYDYALPSAALSTLVPAGTAGRYQVGAVCLRNGTTQLTWANVWAGTGLRRVGDDGSNPGAFTDLTDVPSAYTGQGEKLVAVNAGETALEFVDAPAGGGGDAADVTYTPTTLTDWDTDADPGNVDDALDQLAERVDDLEGGGGAATTYGPGTTLNIGAINLDITVDDSYPIIYHIVNTNEGPLWTINGGGDTGQVLILSGYGSSEAPLLYPDSGNIHFDWGFRYVLNTDGSNIAVLVKDTTGWTLLSNPNPRASETEYTVGDSGDWNATPGTVDNALDELASRVSSPVVPVATDDVSSPPTDAELDTAFGTPATVGAGFTRLLDDNGAGSAMYIVASDGTNWWYAAMTKAV